MSTDWKPGDVAMVKFRDECVRATFYDTGSERGWWRGEGTVMNQFLVEERRAEVVRSLIVIDPIDDQAVKRLADAFCLARWDHVSSDTECDPLTFSSMQAALREFANPTPPKPYRVHIGDSAPWPDVPECHRYNDDDHECPQCAWVHEHDWVAWDSERSPGNRLQVPIRCSKCGGRKCDLNACPEQRHQHGHQDGDS